MLYRELDMTKLNKRDIYKYEDNHYSYRVKDEFFDFYFIVRDCINIDVNDNAVLVAAHCFKFEDESRAKFYGILRYDSLMSYDKTLVESKPVLEWFESVRKHFIFDDEKPETIEPEMYYACMSIDKVISSVDWVDPLFDYFTEVGKDPSSNHIMFTQGVKDVLINHLGESIERYDISING